MVNWTGCQRGSPLAVTLVALLMVVFFSTGCAEQQQLPLPAPAAEVQPEPAAVVPAAEELRDAEIKRLLRRAERALSIGRLTMPERDNAFDRYRAVLQLQPGNHQASAGLDDIVVRYAELTRVAIAHSRWQDASAMIERAAQVRPGNPLLEELSGDLRQAKEAVQHNQPQGSVIPLDQSDLSGRGEGILQVLVAIANRISDSDESVLIVARNDSEGRWMYQQLKLAAEGYRVRGDIKIGSPARIIVLPPL